MKKNLIHLIVGGILMTQAGPLMAAEPTVKPYEATSFPGPESKIDRLVFNALRTAEVEPSRPCSDEVFLRRVYLDLIGTLPQAGEVAAFLKDRKPDKRARLIDSLLSRDEYVDYWSMKWCDLLRVKSEFPINLWPNAVQAYHRWIRESLRENLPYNQMARELLTSSGSNFRVPQVNFFRAVQGSGPQPIAAAVALTLMGSRIESWPADRRAGTEAMFSRLVFKPTAEWKEEIVCLDPAAFSPLDAVLPDGGKVRVPPGTDPRVTFAQWLTAPENRWFARAAVNRTWAWIFGRGIVDEADDLRPDNPPSVPGLLEHLEKQFTSNGYDQKELLRLILNSRVYQLSPLPTSDSPQAAAMFASYPVRRLEAEVLLDAICRITGTTEGYVSPIPEPFSFIPKGARSVDLADGSITSPFLEMFGRSSRDTGLISERSNRISATQRLHLLNSSDIQKRIEKSWRLKELQARHRKNREDMIDAIFMTVLSRPPLPVELAAALDYDGGESRLNAKQATEDLVWALFNSKEFLYRH